MSFPFAPVPSPPISHLSPVLPPLAELYRFSQSAQQNEQEWHTVLEQWDKMYDNGVLCWMHVRVCICFFLCCVKVVADLFFLRGFYDRELRSKKHLWRAGIPLSMRGISPLLLTLLIDVPYRSATVTRAITDTHNKKYYRIWQVLCGAERLVTNCKSLGSFSKFWKSMRRSRNSTPQHELLACQVRQSAVCQSHDLTFSSSCFVSAWMANLNDIFLIIVCFVVFAFFFAHAFGCFMSRQLSID